jgi:hypothetical protein
VNPEGAAVNSAPQQHAGGETQPTEPPQLGEAQVKAMTPAQVKAALDAGQFRDYFATPNTGGNN